MPHNWLEYIKGLLIYVARTYTWMMPYLKGLHLKNYGWREGRNKDLYKTKSQPHVRLKDWEWEHENWLEEKELEALSLEDFVTLSENLDPSPRFKEDTVALKIITKPHMPAVTRC